MLKPRRKRKRLAIGKHEVEITPLKGGAYAHAKLGDTPPLAELAAVHECMSYTPTEAELHELIPPIPDTPENIARACMKRRPKKDWRFLEAKKEKQPVG